MWSLSGMRGNGHNPMVLNELFPGFWLIIRNFNLSAITAEGASQYLLED